MLTPEEVRARYVAELDTLAEMLRSDFPELWSAVVTDAQQRVDEMGALGSNDPVDVPPTSWRHGLGKETLLWVEMAVRRLATPRLLVNQARCLGCRDEPVSTDTHEMRTCRCGRLLVDGGLSYTRRGYRDDDGPSWEELAQYETPQQVRDRLTQTTRTTRTAGPGEPAGT